MRVSLVLCKWNLKSGIYKALKIQKTQTFYNSYKTAFTFHPVIIDASRGDNFPFDFTCSKISGISSNRHLFPMNLRLILNQMRICSRLPVWEV